MVWLSTGWLSVHCAEVLSSIRVWSLTTFPTSSFGSVARGQFGDVGVSFHFGI